MNRQPRGMAAAALAAGVAIGALAARGTLAQGRGEWTTSNADGQRSSWIRNDVRLTKAAVQKGELAFLWKMRLHNQTRQLNSLSQPILLDRLISHRGFKALAFVGASSERVYAVDTDLARPYWETVINFSSITPPANSTWACPGGLTATVTRPTGFLISAFGTGGGGRGGRSGSSVGEPGRGAPSLQAALGRGRGAGDVAGRGRGTPPAAPAQPLQPAAPPRGANIPGGVAGLGGGPTENVYVLGSDGMVRALNAHNGAERYPAVPFLPANARSSGLIFVDGMLYTSTSNNCGAVPNGVYAINLEGDKKTLSWLTGGPSVAGSAGPTFGTDGTIYAAVAEGAKASTSASAPVEYSSSIVALDSLTLKVKDWFTAPGADFNASPVVIRHKDKDLVLATGNDGRLYVLDGASLGGADHRSPLSVSGRYTAAGAQAGVSSWEDQGTRWILAPAVGTPPPGFKAGANGIVTNGSIVAFKLVEQAGAVAVEPAWASRDMTSPLTPIVLNGVVFAASSGEYRAAAGAKLSAAQRAQRSVPAVLYALDPASGKELWSSGKTITSFARSGLSGAAGQVYLVTFDNTLYAFGIPMEH